MQGSGESVTKAADYVVDELRKDGGVGGVIALDHKGNGWLTPDAYLSILTLLSRTVARSQNCPGMYFGTIGKDGIPRTAIFKDDVVE